MGFILNVLQCVWFGISLMLRIAAVIFGIGVAITVISKTADAVEEPAAKVGGGIFWVLSAPFRAAAWIYRKAASLVPEKEEDTAFRQAA